MTQSTVDLTKLKDRDAAAAFDLVGTVLEGGTISQAQLKLAGATSGSITITAPAVAGTRTLVLPAGSTDFTATGGTGQFLKQASAGAAFTVATVPISEVAGLGTGIATFLATPSSANLITAVTNETGSGSLVFATSPTLITPALGTPSSGDISSCTGGPTLTNATLITPALGTPSSGVITSCTGSPTLTAPVLGTATGTSVTVTGNLVTSAGFLQGSTATTLTAAGTTRTDALALTKQFNNVTTAASGTGVILPASATVGVGGRVVVYNNGANLIKVYAAGSDTIDGTAGSTGVSLTNAVRCEYLVIASGAFLSAKLGATST